MNAPRTTERKSRIRYRRLEASGGQLVGAIVGPSARDCNSGALRFVYTHSQPARPSPRGRGDVRHHLGEGGVPPEDLLTPRLLRASAFFAAICLLCSRPAGAQAPPKPAAVEQHDVPEPDEVSFPEPDQAPALPAQPDVVADIRVHGNAWLRDEEVVRLAGVSVGQTLASDSLTQIQRRLEKSGYFETVEVLKRYRALAARGENQFSHAVV
jgi:hypothetical protein